VHFAADDDHYIGLIGGGDGLEAFTQPGNGIRVAEVQGQALMQGAGIPPAACDRNAVFAVAAARQALISAGLGSGLPHPERVGVILGNSSGGQCSTDDQYSRLYTQNKRSPPMTVAKVMVSSSASWVSNATGASGPCFVTSSACASSSHAIGTAMQFLREGLADIVIAGGTEAPLSAGTLLAWYAMKIMSRTLCRPFAAGRDGLMLAEGAGVVVLETEAHARSRGLDPRGEIVGFGSSADPGDIMAPNVGGMMRAMALALADAGLGAGDLAYVNAHGTGTDANDRRDASSDPPLCRAAPSPTSSNKGATGRALGAASALQTVAATMSIERGMAPPTANCDAPDPDAISTAFRMRVGQ